MKEKTLPDGTKAKVYESVDVTDSSSEEIEEQQKKERQWEEDAQEAIQDLEDVYDPDKAGRVSGKEENREKLEMFWEMGDIIVQFEKKHGFDYRNCPNCDKLNINHQKRCTSCKAELKGEEREEYEAGTRILDRGASKDGLPGSTTLGNARSIRLLHESKDDIDPELSTAQYREIGYYAKFPNVDKLIAEVKENDLGERQVRELRNEMQDDFEDEHLLDESEVKYGAPGT